MLVLCVVGVFGRLCVMLVLIFVLLCYTVGSPGYTRQEVAAFIWGTNDSRPRE